MTFEELLEKYQAVVHENGILKEIIKYLNSKLGVSEQRAINDGTTESFFEDSLLPSPNAVLETSDQLSENETLQLNINNMSYPKDKIALFMSLFKGRNDVCAKRWENKKKGTHGYSPYCLNEWKLGYAKNQRKNALLAPIRLMSLWMKRQLTIICVVVTI